MGTWKNIWSGLIGGLEHLIEYFGRPETKENLVNIAKLVFAIIIAVSKKNKEPTNEKKREDVRGFVDYAKLMTVPDIENLLELKRSGVLDRLESKELDIMIGPTTAAFLEARDNEIPMIDPEDDLVPQFDF